MATMEKGALLLEFFQEFPLESLSLKKVYPVWLLRREIVHSLFTVVKLGQLHQQCSMLHNVSCIITRE